MFYSYCIKCLKSFAECFFVILCLFWGSSFVQAAGSGIVQNTKVFKLELGATRVIYHPEERGALLSVTNPQDFPVLVQSSVYKEDRTSLAPFMITPPIFRLDSKQSNTLRIIGVENPVSGKESLYWLCVTGIPPKNGDLWANNGNTKQQALVNIEVSTHMCIKLISRPTDISGSLIQAAESIHWSREGNLLRAKNNSPYYINFLSLSDGGSKIENPDYIPPFSERTFAVKNKASGKVNWSVITDAGGTSRQFSTTM